METLPAIEVAPLRRPARLLQRGASHLDSLAPHQHEGAEALEAAGEHAFRVVRSGRRDQRRRIGAMGGNGAHGLVITLINRCAIVSHGEPLHFPQQHVRRRGSHGCARRDNKLVKEQRWSRLMAAAQEGDRAAYDRLLRETVPFIRAIAARRHSSEDRIDDVVQDVLLTVHRVRHTYDPERPFERWLAAIAERRSIDLLRRRARRAAVETSDQRTYETFPDAGANREGETLARDELSRAIATLPPGQREAIELLKLRELSLKEAARTSGRSIAALKVNVHRAIKALKARLEGR